MSLLTHYTGFRGPAIDIRVGIPSRTLLYRLLLGLMLILVAVGVMNILAMVVLTILIFAEKRLPCLLIARITGLCFFAATVAVVI